MICYSDNMILWQQLLVWTFSFITIKALCYWQTLIKEKFQLSNIVQNVKTDVGPQWFWWQICPHGNLCVNQSASTQKPTLGHGIFIISWETVFPTLYRWIQTGPETWMKYCILWFHMGVFIVFSFFLKGFLS